MTDRNSRSVEPGLRANVCGEGTPYRLRHSRVEVLSDDASDVVLPEDVWLDIDLDCLPLNPAPGRPAPGSGTQPDDAGPQRAEPLHARLGERERGAGEQTRIENQADTRE